LSLGILLSVLAPEWSFSQTPRDADGKAPVVAMAFSNASLSLNEKNPYRTVEVLYPGGGSTSLTSYSVIVEYEAASIAVPLVGSPAHLDVTEGLLFGAGAAFTVTQLPIEGGTARIRVDASRAKNAPSRDADRPGVAFALRLVAVATCATAPLSMTVLEARDEQNAPMGVTFGTRCVINVDVQKPVITNLRIENRSGAPQQGTVTSAKNTDHLRVTAVVSDACAPLTASMITADLSHLRPGFSTVYAETYDPVTHLATWDIPNATLHPSEGSAPVTVSVTDALGNMHTVSDYVLASNPRRSSSR
jgi:hypothetical protein